MNHAKRLQYILTLNSLKASPYKFLLTEISPVTESSENLSTKLLLPKMLAKKYLTSLLGF